MTVQLDAMAHQTIVRFFYIITLTSCLTLVSFQRMVWTKCPRRIRRRDLCRHMVAVVRTSQQRCARGTICGEHDRYGNILCHGDL